MLNPDIVLIEVLLLLLLLAVSRVARWLFAVALVALGLWWLA